MRSPEVPETLEGWTILHQMFQMDWSGWKSLTEADRTPIVKQASDMLLDLENQEAGSACFSLLGHKGDLMLVHFRKTFDELNDTEMKLKQLELSDFWQTTTSYASVLELGLYNDTNKLRKELQDKNVEPGGEEWEEAFKTMKAGVADKMHGRLFPEIPDRRYLCFYPMDRKRGEAKNWYNASIEDRANMMAAHGMIGRSYAGRVKQIISGSIGFDDWEWGVDLFASDPIVFKKLIYEMRFDEASADYALFGPFFLGMRFGAAHLDQWLSGTLPNE